ncbi:FAD/NAD(P)-binding protein [Streptomyces sulfonofaciens]
MGAGAAGAMVAIQLCETAARRRVSFDLTLIDPAPEAGRGTAYSTPDRRHRLNVPAGNMSCYPDDPGHFVRWLCGHGEPTVTPADFVQRYRYGAYLADTLGRAIVAAQGVVKVRRVRARAVGCRWSTAPDGRDRARIDLSDGPAVTADCVVLATGPFQADAAWAPPALRASDRFVADPWAPGALTEALRRERRDDILLVGTGLTAVDMALLLDRPLRTVHAVSRNGRLPQAHSVTPLPAASCPTPLQGLPLAGLRAAVREHIARVQRSHGDWRPALDGLRPVTAEVWAALSAEERAEFVRRDSSLWNVHRHRMPPATAEQVSRMRRTRRLRPYAGGITSVVPQSDGSLTVSVDDRGEPRTLSVGWVVDCTGPGLRVPDHADPLWRSLLDDGAAVPGPLAMGVGTEAGRLRDAAGRAERALWTLGAPRRGELWETTAVPEIRVQAEGVARAVLASWAPAAGSGAAATGPDLAERPGRSRGPRRPLDVSGFPLSTHSGAAAAYRTGVHRLLKVRSGAREAFRRAVALDPGFALAHTALALIGHECGAAVDVPRALADARRCVREGAGAYERSLTEAVARRVQGTRAEGDAALVRHLDTYPGDALALSVAVPTIAFSGLHCLDGGAATRLVERTAPAHDGHWFHTSLMAFVRQEEGRFDEAGELAERALAAEPGSGHAMHALAHVRYERGEHERGRGELDRWLGHQGRGGSHRAHFSWHAALHELALADPAAVRRRWSEQLSPAKVCGIRALVDSGSLLWRARTSDSWQGALPIQEVLETVPTETLERPANAFVALHAGVALAAAKDVPGLRRLHDHALGADAVQRELIAPLCAAFEDLAEERWAPAARRLERLLPRLHAVGGSAAQREVVEETLLYAQIRCGRHEAARSRLADRLDRRPSPHDRRRLAALADGSAPAGAATA